MVTIADEKDYPTLSVHLYGGQFKREQNGEIYRFASFMIIL